MNRYLVAPARKFAKWFLESRRLDRFLMGMCVVSIALTCLIVGALLVEFNTGVYRRYLKPSFEGLRAKRDQLTIDWRMDGWGKARKNETGIGAYRSAEVYGDLTLYTTMGSYPNAELIDMDGKVVHRWQLSFRKKASNTSDDSQGISDSKTHWARAKLFPNGDLIANYNVLGETPYGGGLVRIDKDSKLLWRYPERVHHDFDVDESGAVYAIIHESVTERVAAAPHWKAPMLLDYVVKLSADGKELKRIGVVEAFANSDYCRYLDSIKSHSKGDHTHVNDVQLITPAFASHHNFCNPGDVMISMREPSMLAIMNLGSEKIVWASRGIWEYQHDPDPLDNGNILLLDNRGNKGPGGTSRILEWNPTTGAIEWCYKGTAKEPFETDARGCQELLPNGNVLITESDNGRLFEVSREGKIVWEFNNPHRLKEDQRFVSVVYSGQRFRRDELTFLSPDVGGKSDERVARTNSRDGAAEFR